MTNSVRNLANPANKEVYRPLNKQELICYFMDICVESYRAFYTLEEVEKLLTASSINHLRIAKNKVVEALYNLRSETIDADRLHSIITTINKIIFKKVDNKNINVYNK